MESFDFVDSVTSEKANALARYRRFTNITKLFQLIEIFVGVALISWSSTRIPFVFKLSGEYLLAFSTYVMNQHVVFLVGNVIVVVCYVLSRYTEAGNESVGTRIRHDEGKYNPLNHQKLNLFVSNHKPSPSPPPEKVVESPAVTVYQNRMSSVEKSVINPVPEVTAVTAIKQAAKQIERFQRTQSDKLKSQIYKPRRELRRSVTEKRRSTAVTSGDGDSTARMNSFQAVERLSNEEFRIAVESFISKQQSFLKQQNMVEDDN